LIFIKQERCTGCGACLELCPHGALYLLEGKAVVDEALCRTCEACVAACPEQAIVITEAPSSLPTVQPQQTIRVKTEPAPVTVPLRARVLPVVGAALTWAGREIVPYLANYVLDRLDRSLAGPRRTSSVLNSSSSTGSRGKQGGGRRHRRRRRGA
jgi:NAD-dependent dihydropyrimidine dehydrogenase PreA subunit